MPKATSNMRFYVKCTTDDLIIDSWKFHIPLEMIW